MIKKPPHFPLLIKPCSSNNQRLRPARNSGPKIQILLPISAFTLVCLAEMSTFRYLETDPAAAAPASHRRHAHHPAAATMPHRLRQPSPPTRLPPPAQNQNPFPLPPATLARHARRLLLPPPRPPLSSASASNTSTTTPTNPLPKPSPLTPTSAPNSPSSSPAISTPPNPSTASTFSPGALLTLTAAILYATTFAHSPPAAKSHQTSNPISDTN